MEPKRPFSLLDWAATPEPVKQYILYLEQTVFTFVKRVKQLEKRIEQLEVRTNKSSQNSSQPPSSDGPFKKPVKRTKRRTRKKGGQKGHKGHRQQMLDPTDTKMILPTMCNCGKFDPDAGTIEPFYTHQHMELPEIQMNVTHFILHKGKCKCCGKTVRATVPNEYRSGYGPRLSALIAELSGIEGASRQTVQGFCQSVLGFPISTGAIQNVIDRASDAFKPAYDRIGQMARTQPVNHIDETSWRQSGKLKWLWTMVSGKVSFYLIHNHRSKQAFLELVDDWKGILVSDNYGLYTNWVNLRQSCLAHYIRQVKGLCERNSDSMQRFGKAILKELRLLCQWAKAPPSEKQWTSFYSRLICILFLYQGADDDAGKLA